MKRIIKSLFLLIVISGLFFVSSCKAVKSFEKDVTVTTYDKDGNVVDEDYINIFRNTVLVNAAKVSGLDFLGYSTDKDFDVDNGDRESLIKGSGLVRYNDYEKDIVDGKLNFYPIYGVKEVVHYDLVIAYYAKFGTSGLSDDIINNVKAAVNQALIDYGYEEGELVVVFKGYEGDVATSCGGIEEDTVDGMVVDIMLGWKGNLTFSDESGIQAQAAHENVVMGSKTDRRIHRLTNTSLSKYIFEWFGSEEGLACLK